MPELPKLSMAESGDDSDLVHTTLPFHPTTTISKHLMFMRQVTQSAPRRRFISTMRLVFDFDGTITQTDTIGELAQAAIGLQLQRTGRDLQPAWDHAVQAYLQDYASYRTNFKPPEPERGSIEAETKFLAGLKHAEEASLSRVSNSGLFAGLQREDLFQMGVEAVSSGRVVITEGFEELLNAASRKELNVNVLSVNWSKSFIEGVLHQHSLHVIANEVAGNGEIQGPPGLDSRMTTASDKLRALRQIITSDEQVLYFGDSTTDLECLLLSCGVVIAKDITSPLLNTLSRIGIQVPHIENSQKHKNIEVFWARDFRDVLQSGVLG